MNPESYRKIRNCWMRLVQVMVAVAQQFGNAGRENEARWLLNMAQQLAAALGLLGDETTATANTPQNYLNFLMETLRKVQENPNPQVIYPFWAQNLDKLDENLIYILDSWANDKLASVDTKEAYFIAGNIWYFSELVQKFTLGSIAANKEIAIAGYEITLRVYTKGAFPRDWAVTKLNLAVTYSERIRGNKADNLEKSITGFTEALRVYTEKAFPQSWALTQYNLALIYYDRIRGDKVENLEKSIVANQEALKVYTWEASPQDWALLVSVWKEEG
ncbi:tetratricopeptide repeat protein [Microcystis aeruginosa]|uniref:Tetratricopeptide repeat protein n=1 Tax=Microcystis aeruginosa FD4 TaxID=2686288 RepID=A0A857D985_MICAE|nr:tetratricopeptide repeat protein [Microcystis aeruginosa]QGZ92167.1 tetratricopeptide repeat protein [Microcystis aeruginosa FD4]